MRFPVPDSRRAARFSWWGALAFSHRWLGIAGCLLFILWFLSGIAMMYVRMPEVTPDERFAHAAPLDASAIRVPLVEAATLAGVTQSAPVHVTMLAGRPVYRFGGRTPATVFADRPEKLGDITEAFALDMVRAFQPAATLQYAGLVSRPDQWTLQSRAHLPLHSFRVGDAAGTELYVSSRTGEVVMETTRRERFLAYVGPVAHWLYLPILRRNGPLWTDVIIYSSIAGCVLCLTGLIAGVWRLSPFRKFSARGGRSMSPYAGWLKWHHYGGLLFGVITLTWTFSGLLSMGPFPLFSSGGVTPDQRRALSGVATAWDAVTPDVIQSAVAAAADALTPKELTLTSFRGHAYWIASETPSHHVVVPATGNGHARASFARTDLEQAAREAVPGVPITNLVWLDSHDDYYYDRDGRRPLPVLRVKYDDAERTWLYLDPGRGEIALVVRDRDRLNRWLYHGLHSLDFPWLHNRRPAWDLVVILLSVGGVASAITSLAPAWRRLNRHAARLRGAPPPPVDSRV